MDRAEKIMTAIVIAGMIAVLCSAHRRRGHAGNLTGLRMNTSASPCDISRRGPLYLLSALPSHRRSDDYADPTSYWAGNGDPYSQIDVWRGS